MEGCCSVVSTRVLQHELLPCPTGLGREIVAIVFAIDFGIPVDFELCSARYSSF